METEEPQYLPLRLVEHCEREGGHGREKPVETWAVGLPNPVEVLTERPGDVAEVANEQDLEARKPQL